MEGSAWLFRSIVMLHRFLKLGHDCNLYCERDLKIGKKLIVQKVSVIVRYIC